MVITEVMLFLLGLVLICVGGDRLLNSAVSISEKIGIPQMVIGATVVSLCTTLPEVMVSTTAIFDGSSAVTVGNAIGSVICNTGLIAGIALLFSRPISIDFRDLCWRSAFFAAVLLILMGVAYIFGYFSTPVGLMLLFFFVVYACVSIALSGSEAPSVEKAREDKSGAEGGLAGDILTMLLCAFLLFAGARLLVRHGINLAALLNMPQRAIAVTAIALGTSLPELVTTILSLLKHCEGISVGNVIGANILNLVLVIGIPTTFARVELESRSIFTDMPLALLVMLILTVPLLIRKKSGRAQGFILLAIYIIYCTAVL